MSPGEGIPPLEGAAGDGGAVAAGAALSRELSCGAGPALGV
jgi:hypothetical protein